MTLIEDHALVGDMRSAALVSRDGSIDWLCLPEFDSASCLSALLGDERHGRWLLAPDAPVRRRTRRYRPGTLVLETDVETADGAVRVIDFMPRGGSGSLIKSASTWAPNVFAVDMATSISRSWLIESGSGTRIRLIVMADRPPSSSMFAPCPGSDHLDAIP